jgi:nicotinate-nucleotide adenylyltransferase
MKVGLFGGTFDPPQMGHKKVVRAAIKEVGIDKLYVVPNESPSYKKPNASMEQRYLMLKLMLADVKNAAPAMIEKGNSLTWITVQYLMQLHKINKIELVIGTDCYLDINNWDNVEFLREHCNLVVAAREGFKIPPEPLFPNVTFLKEKMPEISSTETRKLLKKQTTIDKDLFHPKVLEFVQSKGLYV